MKRDLMERYKQQQFEKRIIGCDDVEDLLIICNETPTPEEILQLKECLINELGVEQSLDDLEYGDLSDLAETYGIRKSMPSKEKKLRERLTKLGCTHNLDGFECRDLDNLLKILERKQKIEIRKKKETI